MDFFDFVKCNDLFLYVHLCENMFPSWSVGGGKSEGGGTPHEDRVPVFRSAAEAPGPTLSNNSQDPFADVSMPVPADNHGTGNPAGTSLPPHCCEGYPHVIQGHVL